MRAAIDRIPLEARRIAWRKAIYNEFSEQELAESRRRVAFATDVLEAHLRGNTWICGDMYTLGDINEAASVGLSAIGVTWGFQDRATLARGNPLEIVDTPRELSAAVSRYFEQD